MADLSGSYSLEIDAPIERCFEIASDLDHAPEWQGTMKSVDVLERDDAGRALLVETQIDSGVTRNRLVLRFSYDSPGGMTWTRESGDLKSLDGSWSFADLGDGSTRATYALEIGLPRGLSLLAKTIKGPAEAKVRALLTHRPVEGLKERAEG
jgi:uncharacterized membrane protein